MMASRHLADGWGQAADGGGGETVHALDEGDQVADGKEVLRKCDVHRPTRVKRDQGVAAFWGFSS